MKPPIPTCQRCDAPLVPGDDRYCPPCKARRLAAIRWALDLHVETILARRARRDAA